MSNDIQSSPASTLRTAAYHGDVATVRKLIQEAVDLNVSDQWGRTALSLAAGKGHDKVVSILLSAGAWVDPHEDYDTRETPLIAAAENGHLNIVRMLISAGANPSLHCGVSQATAEFYGRMNGHREISELFVESEQEKRQPIAEIRPMPIALLKEISTRTSFSRQRSDYGHASYPPNAATKGPPPSPCGPDLNGQFGGLQGTGGLEATIVDADAATKGVINDQFGSGVGSVTSGTVAWSATRVSGYGPLAGTAVETFADIARVAEATTWRSHRVDATGFIYLGARYYEPTSGRFLSTDPKGHAASMSLYDYCNGDPVNRMDPDGRIKSKTADDYQSLWAGQPNNLIQDLNNYYSALYALNSFNASTSGGIVPTPSLALSNPDNILSISNPNNIQELMSHIGEANDTVGVAVAMGGLLAGDTTLGSNGKFYTSGWGGNQFVSTLSLEDTAGVLGDIGVGVGVLVDGYKVLNGQESLGKAGLNTAVGVGTVVLPPPFDAALGMGYFIEQNPKTMTSVFKSMASSLWIPPIVH